MSLPEVETSLAPPAPINFRIWKRDLESLVPSTQETSPFSKSEWENFRQTALAQAYFLYEHYRENTDNSLTNFELDEDAALSPAERYFQYLAEDSEHRGKVTSKSLFEARLVVEALCFGSFAGPVFRSTENYYDFEVFGPVFNNLEEASDSVGRVGMPSRSDNFLLRRKRDAEKRIKLDAKQFPYGITKVDLERNFKKVKDKVVANADYYLLIQMDGPNGSNIMTEELKAIFTAIVGTEFSTRLIPSYIPPMLLAHLNNSQQG